MTRTIAHIVNQYLPLSENWIYSQIQSLPTLESTVITPRPLINKESFPLPSLHSFAEQTLLVTLYNRCYRKFTQSGVYPFYENRCRQNNAGLLHAHFGFTGAYFLRLKERLALPMVTTFYGYDLKDILEREPELKTLYPKLFAAGEQFLVEGPAMKKTLSEVGCPADKITVQRLGVALDQLPQSEVVGESTDRVRILMAASFRLKKGHDSALKAFAGLCETHPKAQLDLVGGGPLESDLRRLVRSLGIDERVQFHGFKNRAELNEFIRQTHIFLHPSRETREGDTEGGSPVIITEAAAAGIPVVSTFHADIPEVVQHDHTGLLAPEQDIDTLTKHLHRLVNKPETRRAMGLRAREHVEKNFNLAIQGQHLERLYQGLMRA